MIGAINFASEESIVGEARIWDSETLKTIAKLIHTHVERVYSACWNADEKAIVTTCRNYASIWTQQQ